MIERARITGLVLAGGRATRMGGDDKGLVAFRGEPLVAHALRRLAPQVAGTMVSANRNLDAYAALGSPVITDAIEGFVGPLAGLASALARCETDYLATVPCDAPFFPADLVARLAADVDGMRCLSAFAATEAHDHAVFNLVPRVLADAVVHYLEHGGRSMRAWLATVDAVPIVFDDEDAFSNLNSLEDLARWG